MVLILSYRLVPPRLKSDNYEVPFLHQKLYINSEKIWVLWNDLLTLKKDSVQTSMKQNSSWSYHRSSCEQILLFQIEWKKGHFVVMQQQCINKGSMNEWINGCESLEVNLHKWNLQRCHNCGKLILLFFFFLQII